MPELGRRFEVVGRAVKAQRYELAAYEAHEMQEVFDEDFPRADQPQEVKNDLRPLGDSFGRRFIAPIVEAANAHNPDRLGSAYHAAADACNSCHQAAGKGFIEVPVEPGAACPRVEQ
jgi:cytochrome c556